MMETLFNFSSVFFRKLFSGKARTIVFSFTFFLVIGTMVVVFSSFHSLTRTSSFKGNKLPEWIFPSPPPPTVGTWQAMDGGVTYGSVNDLAADQHGDLYVVGSFHEAGGDDNERVAKWKQGAYWAGNVAVGFDNY
ncbi:MAG: hypothetical protein DWQ02_12620, partial [Bacteroidetes bacterium]